MSSINIAHDYSDLDEILDVGDTDIIVRGGRHTEPSSPTLYGDDYIEDLSQLCSENSDLTQQHYRAKIKLQHHDMSLRHSEDGLLEALQRSMENFECGTMADLASLSSSLDLAIPNNDIFISPAPNEVFLDDFLVSHQKPPVNEQKSFGVQEEVEEDELVSVDEQSDLNDESCNSTDSMLKQLLLNPNNDYRKEIDSTNNKKPQTEKFQNSRSVAHLHETKRKIKRKKLPKTAFTELLKHLESPNNQLPKNTSKPKTRVFNAKQYMRQYGSAPASRVGSPEPDTLHPPKRTVIKPPTHKTKTSRSSTIINPKKPLQVTKVYPISQPNICNTKLNKRSDKTIVASDLDMLLDLFENEPRQTLQFTTGKDPNSLHFHPSTGKRKGTVLIEPLPKKRQRHSQEDGLKKNSLLESTNAKQFHSLPIPDHDYCQKLALPSHHIQLQNGKSTDPNNVVQWEEYLQLVRSGTRSAPNSPAASPKAVRGSSRRLNGIKNRNSSTSVSSPVHQVESPLVAPIITAKIQANANTTIRFQEFEDYLANLKKKENSKQLSSHSTTEVISQSNLGLNTNAVKFVQTVLPSSATNFAVDLKSGSPVAQQTKPFTPNQPFIKVQSGGKIHTAAVTSSTTLPQQNGPLVMIRIPAQSTCVTTKQKTRLRVTSSTSNAANVLYKSTASLCPLKALSASGTKHVTANAKPTQHYLKTVVPHLTQTRKNCLGAQVRNHSSPTFKLITSSKNGGQAKSLILSNVTGQLKDILTSLAKQQQGDKANSLNSSEQQKTLQQLLAAITSMKKSHKANNAEITADLTTNNNIAPSSSPSTVASSIHNGLLQPPALSETKIGCKSSIFEKKRNNLQIGIVRSLRPTVLHSIDQTNTPVLNDVPIEFNPSIFLESSKPTIACSTSFCGDTTLPINGNANADVPLSNNKLPFSSTSFYVKSIVKSTVDSLLDHVVRNCQCVNHSFGRNEIPSHSSRASNSGSKIQFSSKPNVEHSPPADENVLCSSDINDASHTRFIYESAKKSEKSISDDSSFEKISVNIGDDRLYNKLPGYLYSGKLFDTGITTAQSSDVENDFSITVDDRGIGCEVELDNIEYNKLPHYFSSGKLAPSKTNSLYGHKTEACAFAGRGSGPHSSTPDVKYTPEGNVIDPSDTFYSRLPSYYNYGRTHIVDTVTDPPFNVVDDTVTRESLHKQEQEKVSEDDEVEGKEKSPSWNPSDDRILFSKIPSYLMAGRKPIAPERVQADSFHPLYKDNFSDFALNPTRARKKKHLRDEWNRKQESEEIKNRAILQRRVMYVGGISDSITSDCLRSRFEKFGAIDDVTLHFRREKDNYAFVTFRYSNDVIQAIDYGNVGLSPKYTLCFGGRRHFCKALYADLDDTQENKVDDGDVDFDTLLREAMRR